MRPYFIALFTLLSLSANAAVLLDGSGGDAAAPQAITANTSSGSSSGGRLTTANLNESIKNARARGPRYGGTAAYCPAGVSYIVDITFNSAGTGASGGLYTSGGSYIGAMSCSVNAGSALVSCNGGSGRIGSDSIAFTYPRGGACPAATGSLLYLN